MNHKNDPNSLTDMNELLALLRDSAVGGKRKKIDREGLLAGLLQRIKGQDEAMRQIAGQVYAGYARQQRKRPVATFLLVGPPGTGKTETAKALCAQLFDAEEDLLAINCPEYKNAGEAITKLIGAGVAYKGSEQGGTLTRPLFGKKERVVLFDEIEKAHAEVYDVFLSMLQDGYVREQGSNKAADFTSAVVILTSNLDHDKCGEIARAVPDSEQRTRAFKDHFNARGFARPEILDRIPDIVYFSPLSVEVLAEVVMQKIVALVLDYHLTPVHVEPMAAFKLIEAVKQGGDGAGGGIRDLMQTAERRVGPDLADLANRGVRQVTVAWRGGRIRAMAAGEGPPVPRMPGPAAAPAVQPAATSAAPPTAAAEPASALEPADQDR